LTDDHQNALINFVRRQEFNPSNEQNERVSQMDIGTGEATPTLISTNTNENPSTEMQEIYETINILASGIQTLNEDTQRLSSESIRLQTVIESSTQNLATLKLSIQEKSAFLDGIKINQEILQQEVASLKQTVDDMIYVSYDGTLLWRVTNVHEKMSKYKSKKLSNLYRQFNFSIPVVIDRSETTQLRIF